MSRQRGDEAFLKRFGEHLRQMRLAQGLTQEELASGAGFSRSYYTEIETGKRNISLLNLYRIAQQLNVNISALLIWDE